MQWHEEVAHYLDLLTPLPTGPDLTQRVVGLLDVTSLNATDTEASIAVFLEKAQALVPHIAAVCIYPPFVRMAKAELSRTPIQVATVINFPSGEASLETVLIEISRALQDGAQEIDVVFPYQRFLKGEHAYVHTFVSACKAACGDAVLLKVILETGALQDLANIATASQLVLEAGADFIKTSTGKLPTGATLEAAAVMLLVIRELSQHTHRHLGIKLAGGIRTLADVANYLALTESIMGPQWITPHTFRIGASKLVEQL